MRTYYHDGTKGSMRQRKLYNKCAAFAGAFGGSGDVAAAREMTCQEVVQFIEGEREERTTSAFNALMKALT